MRAKPALIGACALLLASAALAQSRAPLDDVDDLEPAVDTSRDRAPSSESRADAVGNLEPAVDTSRARSDVPTESRSAVSRIGAATPPAGSAAAPARARAVPAANAAGSPSAPRDTTPAATVAATTGGSRVIDTLDLGTTTITGNQELPKVLYIVPWKRSDLGDLVGRPVNTLLDEVLTPVDPDVFERSLEYYETLYGESQEE